VGLEIYKNISSCMIIVVLTKNSVRKQFTIQQKTLAVKRFGEKDYCKSLVKKTLANVDLYCQLPINN